jgi:hypothetical protein
MDITSWGPSGWNFLHAAAFAYPDNPTAEERAHMTAFLSALPFVLPCRRCRAHCAEAIAADPPGDACGSMDELSRWVVDLHNSVNARTGKMMMSYDEVYMMYMGPLVAAGCVTRGFGFCRRLFFFFFFLPIIPSGSFSFLSVYKSGVTIFVCFIVVVCCCLLCMMAHTT